MSELATTRLRLRHWHQSDLEPFAAMNRDPLVMEHFLKPLTLEETKLMIGRLEAHIERHRFGLWALEIIATGEFIGYAGLAVPAWESSFTPCVEVGWRLASAHWGKGYATEAARVAVNYGFEVLGVEEILSFTIPANKRSQAVMLRLGMTHDPADDFDHPLVPERHPMRRHLRYRLAAVRRLANLLPARRAMQNDPMAAGQEERQERSPLEADGVNAGLAAVLPPSLAQPSGCQGTHHRCPPAKA